jgi:hypothetical protein
MSNNATLGNMVMQVPAYDIQGKVMHPNNSGVAGVRVELSTGDSLTTGRDGTFSFDNQPPGEYTVSPLAPDLVYTPGQRTLMAEEKEMQYFYALPKPVTNQLLPNSSTLLEFNDTQGLPTRITFPEGLGEQEATVTPILAEEPSGYRSAGHALTIGIAGNPIAQLGEMDQNGETLAIEIEIQYSVADLQSLLDAVELVLMWQSPDGWTLAQSTCPAGSAVDHDLSYRVITVPVCEWGSYALFAPVERIFLPSLANEE